MSNKTVDHRVVEMRFDNKQFEAGAKETMGTLSKLKEALKLPNTGKALEEIDKATKGIKLDGIASGVEALERRFSTFGIVGMRVIENITDGLMNKLHAAVSFVSDSIVSGGIKRAMNIENAHFQLQALLKDETKVQGVMANAMESVDGTAYAYDEAAKAASQFAASGIQAGDEMLNALKGITGVAAMTNSSFEDISRVFTTVAGNGRLMGDQLLQLSSRGLNAASTLADYFREVRGQSGMTEAAIREMVSKGKISFKDFSDAMTWAFGDSAKRANETFTGAMSNMKSALARIGAGFISPLVEQNGELVQLFNALRIKINDVKSALVFDEQRSAIAGLADVTKMSNDELSEMFKTIKTNGKVSISDLDTLTKKGANATDALTKYINGVTDGSIRASYAITNSLSELTNGTKVSIADIRRFVKEGKIDLSTFTAAMEKEFGTEMTLSKQFTDGFLNMVSKIVDAINQTDMTKPMEIFYYWVESIKNLAKGLISVITPVDKAFSDVFLAFNTDDVISFSDAVEKLTAKMKLSEKNSEDLHDAFEGVFSIAKLLLDVVFGLIGAFGNVGKPIAVTGDGLLSLVGAFGRVLTEMTRMVRSCELLRRGFGLVKSGIKAGFDGLSWGISMIKKFVGAIDDLPGSQKLIEAFTRAFENLGKFAAPYVESFLNEVERLGNELFNFGDMDFEDVLGEISRVFENIADGMNSLDFSKPGEVVDAFKNKVKSLLDVLKGNEGLMTFVTNFKKFGEELREAFTLDNLLDRVEKVMDVFGKFFRWVKETMAPAFEDFNIGSAVAAGGGFGIIYSLIKVSKAFEKMSGTISSIPNLLNGVKGTLVAYQKDLNASALLKTAAAIAVLAGALVLLSFADTDRVLEASVALTLIAGTLLLGVSKLLEAVNKGKEVSSALTIFSKGLSKSMKNFSKSLKIKAIGTVMKDFALSVAIIAASIIAIGAMWRKDPEAFTAALKTIGGIGGVIVAIAGLMVLGSKLGDPKGVKAIGTSILMISGSLMLIVSSISKLMSVKLPEDYKTKLAILGGIIAGLGVLALALGVTARIAGGNQLPKLASTVKSLAILMVATVLSLKALFAMDIPEDYKLKLGILAGIFAGFGVLLVAMGAAAKIAGGNSFKAAGTILSMALFLAVVVAALFVLTLIPGEKMLKGALALGSILVTLGVALYGAGQISDKNAYKSVIAMALTVGVITAALAVLSMISWQNLLKSTVALGSVLLALALNFKEVTKIQSKKALPAILAMIAASVAIAYSLYVLAEQPWQSLLSAAAAMSVTLMAFSKSFEMILGKRWSENNVKKIGTFLLLTLAVIPIGVAIGALAQQPWSGLLTAAAGLSLVLIAMSGCFVLITKAKPNMVAIGSFLAASVGVTVIALGLSVLAHQPLDGILAATLALGVIIAEVAALMLVCTVVGSAAPAALAGIGIMAAVIAALTGIIVALGALMNFDGFQQLLNGGIQAMTMLGEAIGGFIGGIVSGVLTRVSSTLPQIGSDLSQFMINLGPFISGSKMLDPKSLACVGFLTAIILALTAAEVINGITSLFGLSLVDMAIELSAFMVALTPFIMRSKMLSLEAMEACGYLAGMILKLTAANVISGIANFFGLSGSISDFGKELSEFGPYIKQFAEDVKDVKPEAVQGAAAAAEIMAEVAKKLPGTDGLVQKIFGEKSLAEFGEELVLFGPKIKKFGEMVKDVKPEAVEGAASAAEIMANLADKLPAQDGLLQKIMGEKSLSEFGTELVAFGPLIKQFSNEVSGINPESVNGVAAITDIMTTLANNLPDSDTLWNKIFGGGKKSISEFGTELVTFGASMSLVSKSISGVNSMTINDAIESFKSLVDLAAYVEKANATNITKFANELTKIGSKCVDGFVSAFTNSASEVAFAINIMVTSALMSITNKNAEFLTKGTASVNQYLTGIKNQYPIATTTGTELSNQLLLAVQLKNTEFFTVGINFVNQFLQAFRNKYRDAMVAGKTLSNNALAGCRSLYSPFYQAGANGGQGFIDGLRSKISAAASAGYAIGRAAYEAAKRALDEHSPSKKMGEVGDNAGLGFVNQLMMYVAKAASAGKEIGKAAIDGTESGLQMLDDFGDFVLHPRVDMDNVYSSIKEIEELFNNAINNIRTNAIGVSTQVQNAKNGTSDKIQDQNKSVSGGVSNYTFNQYNTSPKALSRIDIYRQTNNQFRQFKEVTNPT